MLGLPVLGNLPWDALQSHWGETTYRVTTDAPVTTPFV